MRLQRPILPVLAALLTTTLGTAQQTITTDSVFHFEPDPLDPTVGTYVDYVLPTVAEIDASGENDVVLYFWATGGNGGRAYNELAFPTSGYCEALGGFGATAWADFVIRDSGASIADGELAAGGVVRVIVGDNGEDHIHDGSGLPRISPAGGGGGSAVLYRAPGAAEWILLVVGGAGGGAYSSSDLLGCLTVEGGKDGSLDECGLNGYVNGPDWVEAFYGACDGEGVAYEGYDYSTQSEVRLWGNGGGGGAFSPYPILEEPWGSAGYPAGGLGGFETGTFNNSRGGWGFGGGGAGGSAILGESGGGGGGGYSGGGAGAVGAGGGGGSYTHPNARTSDTVMTYAEEGSIGLFFYLIPAVVEPDADGDGWPDAEDNCPSTPSADLSDLDGDGLGNVCDPDDDGDGIDDAFDNCPLAWNPDQSDADHDGVGDACDPIADPYCSDADAFEPNDECQDSKAVTPGTYALTIGSTDDPQGDWEDDFTGSLEAGETVTVDLAFDHSRTNVDLQLASSVCGWPPVAASESSTDGESVTWTNDTGATVQYQVQVLGGWAGTELCNDYEMTVTHTPPSGPVLQAEPFFIDIQVGGTQTLDVDYGSDLAGVPYIILGSASGFFPGIEVAPGVVLPLNPDFYLTFTLEKPGSAPYTNFLGVLDGAGRASASFDLPALPGVFGLTLWHAAVALPPGGDVVPSNHVQLETSIG